MVLFRGRMFRVYGVPLSQPFRSVIWALLQKKVPFEIKATVPGVKGNNGTLSTSYMAKTSNRITAVPLLEVDDKHCIPEGPAILTYLCESQKDWEDWYAPSGTIEKAHIDGYLHWHHNNTRKLAHIVAPFIRPDDQFEFPDEKRLRGCMEVLKTLDEGWLGGPKGLEYLANNKCSIADILCYGEISQVHMTHLVDMEPYANLCRWIDRMRSLPFHDDVHTCLTSLGTLTGVQSSRKIAEASRAGYHAIKLAKESYENDRPPLYQEWTEDEFGKK